MHNSVDVESFSLLVDKLTADLEEVKNERGAWKQRAEQAEAELEALKDKFGLSE